MSRLVVKTARMRDLPPELTEGLDAQPEDLVRVTVDAERGRLVEDLLALADRMGAEATRRGLTDEKLEELLEDRSG